MERDYDNEWKDTAERRYAYDFDMEVMHPFMVRAMEPFWRSGPVLELGSFRGQFTQRLLDHFSSVTCIEASGEAVQSARERLGHRVDVIQSRFEDATLNSRFETIVMTHVLEHLDDPIGVLRKVATEWLSETGRFFVICPNANAPSRQIAVKMGLLSHNSCVTPAEAEHGHRVTYSFDTLERDARAAGLRVIYRSGIFFKALANFQWDQVIKRQIVSADYLEGCFQLGHQYPDLCSSIMLVCERGE